MLSRCIESIRKQTVEPVRIVLFDNGSAVPASTRISGGDLLHVRSETNLGFAGGINAAMQSVATRFVAWINNDVVLSPEWTERVLSAISGSDDIAGAQSIIMRPDRRIDGAGISVEGTIRQIGHGQTIDQPLPDEVWGVSATAAVFRTESLHSVAVDGEILLSSLFAYYEDVELCARLRRAGLRFVLVHEALAMHEGSKSASLLPHGGLDHRVRNRYLVHRLHPGVGRLLSLLGEDLRRVVRLLLRARVRDAGRIVKSVLRGISRKS